MAPKLEIHHEGEWSALYVDGQLERVGDAYRSEERAFEILGVKIVHDDAFMRGQGQASGVAQTLDDVDTYRTEREEKRATAERLREKAAKLIADAEALDGGKP
jgi:hypothetical protein